MEAITSIRPMPVHSPAFLKERKFLMFIPLLIVPFLTMGFWALGGGKTNAAPLGNAAGKGLNTTLPMAQFKDPKPENKLAIYQRHKQDSAGSADNGVSPSFIHAMGFTATNVRHDDSLSKRTLTSSETPAVSAEANEAMINAKLAQINRQINQPQTTDDEQADLQNQQSGADVKRLELMMKAMKNNGGSSNDPEMKQLNNMLTKIAAIENPQSVKTPLKKKKPDTVFRAISAIVDGKQKVMDGGTVRLMLTEPVKLKGIMLPKGQLLFGACQITNQRLLLNIQNIRIGKSILPADLTVFSLDGMPGIPAPEAEIRDAAGSGAGNALDNMQILSMDESIGGQAAAGGINAAKGLFNKKVTKIRVKLHDKFAVLLRDNDRKK